VRIRRFLLAVLTVGLTAGAAASLAAETQYNGQCAMSVAKGTPVPTDCSIYWISPQDKLYCFSSVAAREQFLANEPRNAELADAFWRDPAFWEKLKEQK
jgi:hypothetical protein